MTTGSDVPDSSEKRPSSKHATRSHSLQFETVAEPPRTTLWFGRAKPRGSKPAMAAQWISPVASPVSACCALLSGRFIGSSGAR